jgi:hypothetical protein
VDSYSVVGHVAKLISKNNINYIYSQMEDFITFLEFENGVIIINDSNFRSLKMHSIIGTVKSIVQPIIFQRKLSGKIKVERLNNKVTIAYVGVTPFENVAELMQAIKNSSSAEDYG